MHAPITKTAIWFQQKLDPQAEQLIDLMNSSLQLNPYLRPTAYEALSNSIFDSVRSKSQEDLLKKLFTMMNTPSGKAENSVSPQ